MEVDQEGVLVAVGSLEGNLFSLDAWNLVVLDDELLFQDFHGVELLGFLLLDQQHLSKVAAAQGFEEGEILQAWMVLLIEEPFAGTFVCGI